MTKKAEGRHRFSEDPLEAVEPAPALLAGDSPAPLTPDPLGRFAVQILEGHWFIGPPGAAQRIEDGQWLDIWLAANGSTSRDVLDFAGDQELQHRFHTEFVPSHDPRPTDPQRTGDTP